MGPLLSFPKTKCSDQDSCIWVDHSSVDLQSYCQFSILPVLKGNTSKLVNSLLFSDWGKLTVCVLRTECFCCKINSGDLSFWMGVVVCEHRLPIAYRSFGKEEIPIESNPTFLCILYPCCCCDHHLTSCLQKNPKINTRKKPYCILLVPPW